MGVEFIKDKLLDAQLVLTNEVEPQATELSIERNKLEQDLRKVIPLLEEAGNILASAGDSWTKVISAVGALTISTETARSFTNEAYADGYSKTLRNIGLELTSAKGSADGLAERFPPEEPSPPSFLAERVRGIMDTCKDDLLVVAFNSRKPTLNLNEQTEQAADNIAGYLDGITGSQT